MNISFINDIDCEDFTFEMETYVKRALQALAENEGLDFSLNILITDDLGIASLNSEFRGINKPTDVLSFPAYVCDSPLKVCLENMLLEYENGLLFIGDIAISMETTILQAENIGNSVLREFIFLAVHGALHLLGYDHCNIELEETMKDMQHKIMSIFSF